MRKNEVAVVEKKENKGLPKVKKAGLRCRLYGIKCHAYDSLCSRRRHQCHYTAA